MAINVGQLVVDMRADTAALVGDLGKAERAMGKTAGKFDLSLKGIQTGVGQVGRAFASLGISIAAIGVGSLALKFRELVDTAGGLGELAQQLGVTTDTLQSLQYAAVQAGVESSELETSLSTLTRTIGDAAAGQKSATDAFAQAGITFSNYNGSARATEDVLRDVAERIRSAGTEAERASIAQDLLGRSGQRLIPILMGGSSGLDELARAAREAGVMLSAEAIATADEASDAMARFDLVVLRLQQNLAILTLGPLTDFVSLLERASKFEFSAIGELANVLNPQIGGADVVGDELSRLLGFLPETVIPSAGRDGRGNPVRLPTGSDFGSGGGGGGDTSSVDKIQRVIDALQLEADNLERTAEQQRLYNELSKAGTDLKTAEGQQIAALVHQIEQRAAAERELQDLLAAEQALMAEGKALTESLLTPTEIYAAQLARLAELKAANAISDETMARATEHYTEELNQAIGKVDNLDQSTDELNVNMEQFGSLLADAALGLRSWGDVARSVFQEAINWVMRYIEATSSTKSMGGGGGIFDLIFNGIGSLFGGGGANPGVGPGGLGFLSFGGPRADGGPVAAGRTYLVGEQGPELFTAAANGSILPNDRLGDLMPGGPVFFADLRGASAEAVARLELLVARLHGSLEPRAVAATQDARSRMGRYGAAFRR